MTLADVFNQQDEAIAVTFPRSLYGFRFPADVEGYFFPAEGAFLYTLARLSPPGPVAELGSYKGKSAICLAQARPVTCVDHFQGEDFVFPTEEDRAYVYPDHLAGTYRQAFDANIARYGLTDRVTVIAKDTVEAAAEVPDGTFALIFIDAAHDQDAVVRDVQAWGRKLAEGGALVFDDRDFPGVADVLRQLVEDHKCIREDGPGKLAVIYPPLDDEERIP